VAGSNSSMGGMGQGPFAIDFASLARIARLRNVG
jgi:hypothetical protein